MFAKSAAAVAALAALTIAPLGAAAQDRGMRMQERISSGVRVALVVGNSAYTDSPLANPANDARAVASTLRELGFEVIDGTNLTQREMKEKARDFGNRLRSTQGVGLFFFAGHGVQVQGRNYLIPIGATIRSETEVEYEALDVGFVLAQMDAAGNPLNLVILDACRNNPFARSFRDGTRGLAQVSAPTGTLIAYATAPGSVASDGSGSNGLYTQELLRQLRVPDLPAEEMFKRVRMAVREATGGQQTPWESSSLVGDFYFRRRAVVQASPLPGPTPAPTPPAPVAAVGSLANLDMHAIRFFESAKELPVRNLRVYADTFESKAARYINYELDLNYSAPGRVVAVPYSCGYTRPNGDLMHRWYDTTTIQPTWPGSWHAKGRGWDEPGNWQPGTYQVSCEIGRASVTDSFTVTGDIPSIQARVTQIRFFEEGPGTTPEFKDRVYPAKFDSASSRYITLELHYVHPAPGREVNIPLVCTRYRPDGSVATKHEGNLKPQGTWTSSIWTGGAWGAETASVANWAVGKYKMECEAEGKTIMTGHYEIVGR